MTIPARIAAVPKWLRQPSTVTAGGASPRFGAADRPASGSLLRNRPPRAVAAHPAVVGYRIPCRWPRAAGDSVPRPRPERSMCSVRRVWNCGTRRRSRWRPRLPARPPRLCISLRSSTPRPGCPASIYTLFSKPHATKTVPVADAAAMGIIRCLQEPMYDVCRDGPEAFHS